ncbi:MAG: dTDP-4-dehydrorhamnose 3,5-epimerase [Acidobacteriaceae bacterium]
MKFCPTTIPDVVIVDPEVFTDDRGHFFETWHAQKFRAGGIDANFVQDNHSWSLPRVLRGLHYQLHRPQGKLVRVVQGAVFDVAVDLRRSSTTFGHWVGTELSESNHHMLWVPPGFAHGFYVTEGPAVFLYKCTDMYQPGDERCIRWDDPELAIAWPIPPGSAPIVGVKDRAGVAFRAAEVFP